ncbi:hypothetical protein EAL2_808p04890 (plasmid) [Peptoclostridium acidaminophilum DSM 3953]|uniref:YknX-like beta-barrel domain-containing protein n=1 Tax=Peptoclostridium acidaminophilum DSM 3953 TaxID=1286171 RepID=W8TPC7_PEPAC|nr:efflux RND transporter periplasmic adaptor subunit [Peptoclostridium acidaminophilum]AHM57992.1 hypothetical protein EAL2_808p04890 [Peptoclostridium acidaminophilum DSM 3953]
MNDMKKHQNKIFIGLAIVIMAGVGVWFYFYWQGSTYYKTDNAKVSAELRTVASLSSGRIVKLNVSEGDIVKENQVIGRLNSGAYLRSPIDGEVVKLNVVLNQVISPSTVAAVIAQTSDIYVGANIEETGITKINEQQEVVVQLDAYPGKKFKGHIEEIDQVTQAALSGNATSFSTSGTYTKVTQLIPVKIVIDDDVELNGLIGTNSTVKIKIK